MSLGEALGFGPRLCSGYGTGDDSRCPPWVRMRSCLPARPHHAACHELRHTCLTRLREAGIPDRLRPAPRQCEWRRPGRALLRRVPGQDRSRAGHPPPQTMTASPERPAARGRRCAGRLITTPQGMTGSDASRHPEAVSTGRAFRFGRAGLCRPGSICDWACFRLAAYRMPITPRPGSCGTLPCRGLLAQSVEYTSPLASAVRSGPAG